MAQRKKQRSLDQDLSNNVSTKVNVKQEVKTEPLDMFVPPVLHPKTENLNNFATEIAVKHETKLVPKSEQGEHVYGITPDQSKLNEVVFVYQGNPHNEPIYCVCNQVSFGHMIACDNDNCQGGEWFHFECVGMSPDTRFMEKWYCQTCRVLEPAKTEIAVKQEERIVPNNHFARGYERYDLSNYPLYCNDHSEWLHYQCVGLHREAYCPTCRHLPSPH